MGAAIAMTGPESPDSARERLQQAFTSEHFGLLTYHVLVGALVGGLVGVPAGLLATRQLEAERERFDLERNLARAQRLESVGRLATGVAHDFNNLLSALKLNLYLTGVAKDPTKAKAYATEAQHVVDRAASLPRQLLAFARRRPAEPEVVSPDALARDLQKMLGRLIEDDINLTADLAAEANVLIDPGAFEQVLVNFVVNARDAMPDGGAITMRSRTLLMGADAPDGLPPGHYVSLSVTDTGSGMPPEVAARAFEPFFTTKEDSGTGLGLATSYGIARQAGGTIQIISAAGQGTTMDLLLPVTKQPPAQPVDAVAAQAVARTQRHILVADDLPGLRDIVADVLRTHGHTVSLASDGQEALEVLAKESHIDLVFADVRMPRLSGDALAARLATDRPDLAVILTTARGYESDRWPVIAKPYEVRDLLAAIDDAPQRNGHHDGA